MHGFGRSGSHNEYVRVVPIVILAGMSADTMLRAGLTSFCCGWGGSRPEEGVQSLGLSRPVAQWTVCRKGGANGPGTEASAHRAVLPGSAPGSRAFWSRLSPGTGDARL